MAIASAALRAELSHRIRTAAPAEWNEFSKLWMAFNAIYGGEPDQRERARVMASVRKNMNERRSLRVLRTVTKSVKETLNKWLNDFFVIESDEEFGSQGIRR